VKKNSVRRAYTCRRSGHILKIGGYPPTGHSCEHQVRSEHIFHEIRNSSDVHFLLRKGELECNVMLELKRTKLGTGAVARGQYIEKTSELHIVGLSEIIDCLIGFKMIKEIRE
jgi:hypothetical protein